MYERLRRSLPTPVQALTSEVRDFVAEIGAAFLCAEFGFDVVSRSASYLDHWLQACKANPRAIFAAASNASKAAEFLRGLALAEPMALAA